MLKLDRMPALLGPLPRVAREKAALALTLPVSADLMADLDAAWGIRLDAPPGQWVVPRVPLAVVPRLAPEGEASLRFWRPPPKDGPAGVEAEEAATVPAVLDRASLRTDRESGYLELHLRLTARLSHDALVAIRDLAESTVLVDLEPAQGELAGTAEKRAEVVPLRGAR